MYNKLLKIDENISGNLHIKEKNKFVVVYGKISTSKKEEIKDAILEYVAEKYPMKLVSLEVNFNNFVVLEGNSIEGNIDQNYEQEIDEVKIIFNGMMKTDLIVPNITHKKVNPKNKDRINNTVRVLNFIAPIVLNQDLKIIDGQVRLEMAIENGIKEVPVIIIETTYIQENTLRLALNRSSEFQRWNWVDVDNFVDDYPVVQPILEPLGFWGRYVLPESFFTDTVIQYTIDPFNKKQMSYNQEWGLAKWAEIRRGQMAKAVEEKYKPKERKPKPKRSLFDLTPKKEDFLETYNADEEMEKFGQKWKEIATEISAKKDIWSKERKEALGQEWQIKNRNSKEVAGEVRESFVELLQDSEMFTDIEIEKILEPKALLRYRKMSLDEIRDSLDKGEEF